VVGNEKRTKSYSKYLLSFDVFSRPKKPSLLSLRSLIPGFLDGYIYFEICKLILKWFKYTCNYHHAPGSFVKNPPKPVCTKSPPKGSPGSMKSLILDDAEAPLGCVGMHE